MIVDASIAGTGEGDYNALFSLPAAVEVKLPQRKGPAGCVTIKGSDLEKLFKKKPEVAEYVHLEIQNMKAVEGDRIH